MYAPMVQKKLELWTKNSVYYLVICWKLSSYNIVLTLTLTAYLTANTIFAPVHRPVFNTDYILIATQNIINSFIP